MHFLLIQTTAGPYICKFVIVTLFCLFLLCRNAIYVGLVAINVQQPLIIAAAAAGVAPTMCTHPRCQRLAATIIEEELELAATFVEEELELVAPFLPINRQ
jgi:hypothetical protein